MPRSLERACGVQVVDYKIMHSRLNRVQRRVLLLRSLAMGRNLGNLEEAVHRINKPRKWKSWRRAMEIERNYQINLRFKYKELDRDIRIHSCLKGMAVEDHRGM